MSPHEELAAREAIRELRTVMAMTATAIILGVVVNFWILPSVIASLAIGYRSGRAFTILTVLRKGRSIQL